MHFEICRKICPFWICSLIGNFGCTIDLAVGMKFCSFNYACDGYLNCSKYLDLIEESVEKFKETKKRRVR